MAEREHTPPALAKWLVELARRTTLPLRDVYRLPGETLEPAS